MPLSKRSRKIIEEELSRVLRRITVADLKDYGYVNLSIRRAYYDPEGEEREYRFAALEKQDWLKLRDVAERCFKGRISPSTLKGELHEAFDSWSADYPPPNNEEIQKRVEEIVDRLQEIVEHKVQLFAPLSGLKFTGCRRLPVARCWLAPGSSRSELAELLAMWQERHNNVDFGVPPDATFLVADVWGDTRTFREQGYAEVDDALAVLRTMTVSRVHPDYKFNFRIMTSPGFSRELLIWREADGDGSGLELHLDHVDVSLLPLTDKGADILIEKGLESYSDVFRAEQPGLGVRMARAIQWFSNGVSAARDSDAVISYMISIESLLSAGRQSKESLGQWVAAILVQSDDLFDLFVGTEKYPIEPGISREFYDQLRGKSVSARREVVKERFVELYGLRNAMLHGGAGLDPVVSSDMFDLEFIARSLIAAIVTGPWPDENALRHWLRGEVNRGRPAALANAFRSRVGRATEWIASSLGLKKD